MYLVAKWIVNRQLYILYNVTAYGDFRLYPKLITGLRINVAKIIDFQGSIQTRGGMN